MKLDFTKVSYDGKWYEYPSAEEVEAPNDDGVFIKVRPWPMSKSTITVSMRGVDMDGAERLKQFKFCFRGQRGIVGGDDQPLPEKWDDKMKTAAFDHNMGDPVPLPTFVLGISDRKLAIKQAAEKN